MVFYLTEEGKRIIDPTWLYIYFRRNEFLREVTFRNFGSQRPEFNFEDMSDIIIPLPDLPTQQKYVDIYNAMVANQQAYERGLEDLKLTCDGYIEELRRKMPCEKIGKYIELTEEDRAKVTGVYHAWQQEGYEETYQNVPEFCYSASFDEVAEKGFTLVPSRYIEFVNRDENIDFDTKMKTLQSELRDLLVAEEKSKADLLTVFKELGYEIEL